jgi:hypothetical protein
MNAIEKVKLLWNLNKLYQQWKELKAMTNWKTTVGAMVTTIAFILKLFKIEVPAEVLDSAIVVGIFIIGIFAKDSNVTGGTKQQ